MSVYCTHGRRCNFGWLPEAIRKFGLVVLDRPLKCGAGGIPVEVLFVELSAISTDRAAIETPAMLQAFGLPLPRWLSRPRRHPRLVWVVAKVTVAAELRWQRRPGLLRISLTVCWTWHGTQDAGA